MSEKRKIDWETLNNIFLVCEKCEYHLSGDEYGDCYEFDCPIWAGLEKAGDGVSLDESSDGFDQEEWEMVQRNRRRRKMAALTPDE